jgi:hypothetical protein
MHVIAQHSVVIPTRIANALAQDGVLRSFVNGVLHSFEPWLNAHMPFFPDFTEHDTRHLTRVLHIAEALIRDTGANSAGAWFVVSPADMACLIVGTVLHDAAMHLTPESFLLIIRGKSLLSPIPPFDNTPWATLWANFINEARRWDDGTRETVFGKASFSRRDGKPADVDELPDDLGAWDDYDKRLAGEFIRRHHARLAHEFALFGVPGPGIGPQVGNPDRFPEFADMAGLAARSHGIPLRRALEYFDLHDRREWMREYRGLHVVFVMALLRVADCLDLYAERADDRLLTVRKISRYSGIEWSAHGSIDDIQFATPYPEAVTVLASPRDADSFLKVRQWLATVQQEIDQSFAALGEVYGEHGKLRDLGLAFRRVRSNLDDVEKFASRPEITYVPTDAAFRAADTDLLKLLVKPLYRDNPTLGVRELIQNAVDAVRELDEIRRRREAAGDPIDERELTKLDQEADVLVHLRSRQARPAADPLVPPEWDYWLEVHDRGIGMNVHIVRDYFLVAGATYRRSREWVSQFVEPGTSSPCVIRSGRFGIGALAIFLLGDEFVVRTRRFDASAKQGISFRCRLTDRNVELRRVPRTIGTFVAVRLGARRFERLRETADDWQWYYHKSPRCVRLFNGRRLRAEIIDTLSPPWRVVQTSTVSELRWSLARHPQWLLVNGMEVWTEPSLWCRHGNRIPWHPGLSISVTDRDCNVPLNLTRTDYSEPPPYDLDLERSIIRAEIARLLADPERFDEAGVASCDGRGIIPLDNGILWHARVRMVLGYDRFAFDRHDQPPGRDSGGTPFTWAALPIIGDFAGRDFVDADELRISHSGFAPVGCRVHLHAVALANSEDFTKAGPGVWKFGRTLPEACGFRSLPQANAILRNLGVVVEWTLPRAVKELSLFAKIWLDELQLPPVIPLKDSERRRQCAFAYQALTDEFRQQEAIATWNKALEAKRPPRKPTRKARRKAPTRRR